MPSINTQLQVSRACDVCRRLEVAEAKHEQLLEEKRAMEADFKQVLSQYDTEFEDKGDQMAAQLQQVRSQGPQGCVASCCPAGCAWSACQHAAPWVLMLLTTPAFSSCTCVNAPERPSAQHACGLWQMILAEPALRICGCGGQQRPVLQNAHVPAPKTLQQLLRTRRASKQQQAPC